MITEHDLDEAIAECQGKRNPSASDCIKLAAFLQIKERMYPKETRETDMNQDMPVQQSYSYARGRNIEYESDTPFGKAVYGQDIERIMPLMDELVETLSVINGRLYDAFMRKLSDL